MIFTLVTLFPSMFDSVLGLSMMKRAQEDGHIQIQYINIRDFATDKYKTVDDHPYGGGAGMILKVDVVDSALRKAHEYSGSKKAKTRSILLDPRGESYTQKTAKRLAKAYDHLILVCGHYEGVDERIRSLVDETVSIGDYVVTGGELPAMMIIDSVTRLLPKVLHPDGPVYESFENGLEYPQYTRPQTHNGMSVPDVLVSGNHRAIEEWKTEQAALITKKHRPDLLNKENNE